MCLAAFASATLLAQEKRTFDTSSWQERKGGVLYSDPVEGAGKELRRGQTVTVHYTGWLPDGTQFQSSHDSGRAFVFKTGQGQVVQGWEIGLPGMKVKGKRLLFVPWKKGYGKRGVKNPQTGEWVIPPGSDLVFEIELLAAN